MNLGRATMIMVCCLIFCLYSLIFVLSKAGGGGGGGNGYYAGGHSPPRRGGGGRRNIPPDPHSMEYPASLKQYADWFRHSHPKDAAEEDGADKAAEQEAGDGSRPRDGIRARWEKYKKDFAAKQVRSPFFLNLISLSNF